MSGGKDGSPFRLAIEVGVLSAGLSLSPTLPLLVLTSQCSLVHTQFLRVFFLCALAADVHDVQKLEVNGVIKESSTLLILYRSLARSLSRLCLPYSFTHSLSFSCSFSLSALSSIFVHNILGYQQKTSRCVLGEHMIYLSLTISVISSLHLSLFLSRTPPISSLSPPLPVSSSPPPGSFSFCEKSRLFMKRDLSQCQKSRVLTKSDLSHSEKSFILMERD